MSETTRRRFLVAGGAGAVAGGIGLLSPGVAGAAPGTATSGMAASGTAAVAGPIVAHIQDVRTGLISVMVGETAVTVRDPGVVAALARAAARA